MGDEERPTIYEFVSAEEPIPANLPASLRPANRPRVVELDEGDEEPTAYYFEGEGLPVPPGTKAQPRPKGRERQPVDETGKYGSFGSDPKQTKESPS
jgi:hypothetical protein